MHCPVTSIASSLADGAVGDRLFQKAGENSMDRRLCLHTLTIVTAGIWLPSAAFAGKPHRPPGPLSLPCNERPVPSDRAIAPDPLYAQAVAIVMKNKKASISLVQRHLKLGYSRAAGLLHSMEQAGLISTHHVNGYRQILATATQHRLLVDSDDHSGKWQT